MVRRVYSLEEGSDCGKRMCLRNHATALELTFNFLVASLNNLIGLAFDLRTTHLSSGTGFSARIFCP